MGKLYSVDELTKSIVNDFQLSMEGESAMERYKAKIYRALHDTGIWENAKEELNNKSKTKYFTEEQKQQLLSSEEMYDYVRDNSQNEQLKKSKRYKEIQEEIQRRRIEHIAYLTSREQEVDCDSDSDGPYISDDEFNQAVNKMMLIALFEHFFTPINEELFRQDLNTILYKDEMMLEDFELEAEQRLEHPEGNYYTRREEQK